MSKLRPSCQSAMPQGMRSRSERQTCLQQAGALRPICAGRSAESGPSQLPGGGSDPLQPPDRCPVTEAINSQPPDGCPTGEGLITPTAGLDRGRRAKSTPSFRPALPAKDQRQTPLRQHSLLGDRGRANHPPVVPVQQGSRTQVSMVGNLGKSLTMQSLSRLGDRQKRACGTPSQDCRKIVHKT